MTSPHEPPKPQALDDEALAAKLVEVQETGGALAAMELLETQTQLRAQDAQALSAWQAQHPQTEVVAEPEVVEVIEVVEVVETSGFQIPDFFTESLIQPVIEPEPVSEVEPEPQRASDYATGGFDIVETAQNAVVDEFDHIAFDDSEDDESVTHLSETPNLAEPLTHVIRRSKAISQLFVWSGILVGVLPIILGAIIAATKLSYAWQLVAIILGFGIATVLIASAAIAGKRSGLQTLMLTRAAFGVRGNSGTAALAILAKLIFGTIVLAYFVSQVFGNTVVGLPDLTTSLVNAGGYEIRWLQVVFAGLAIVAAVFAVVGGRTLYVLQSSAAIVGLLAAIAYFVTALGSNRTANAVSFALEPQFLPAVLLIAGLIAAGVGAFWSTSVADFTRQVPMSERGMKLVLFVALAVLVLAGGSTAIAAYLATSFGISQGARSEFLQLLDGTPAWLGSVLLIAGGLQLIVWAASWLYSTSVSLRGIGIRTGRVVSQVIVVVLVLAVSVVGSLISIDSIRTTALITLVVLMAFVGIFAGDVWRRRKAYDETSLRQAFGFYGSVNVLNLVGFALAIVIGMGFIGTSLDSIYVTNFIGRFIDPTLYTSGQPGILVALVVSAVFASLFSGARIREQEKQVAKIEARRGSLLDVNLTEVL